MEAAAMINPYNLSLIFYPQTDGQYHVTCPDLPNCFTCGATLDEARERVYDLIAEILPEQIRASAEDEEAVRLGLCMEGKLYQEVKAIVGEAGEVVFPSATHGLRVAV
jgi:predicted RNase H-like HicB family nuclease